MAVTAACDDIRKSEGFEKFLDLVLLVGNYMGSSVKTFKEAFAFELSTLTKVQNVFVIL